MEQIYTAEAVRALNGEGVPLDHNAGPRAGSFRGYRARRGSTKCPPGRPVPLLVRYSSLRKASITPSLTKIQHYFNSTREVSPHLLSHGNIATMKSLRFRSYARRLHDVDLRVFAICMGRIALLHPTPRRHSLPISYHRSLLLLSPIDSYPPVDTMRKVKMKIWKIIISQGSREERERERGEKVVWRSGHEEW